MDSWLMWLCANKQHIRDASLCIPLLSMADQRGSHLVCSRGVPPQLVASLVRCNIPRLFGISTCLQRYGLARASLSGQRSPPHRPRNSFLEDDECT